jgi:thiol:disulfide interchange protein DsbD
MVGDWTNFNPEITALLSKYQRSGIPLYLLYPSIADAPPVILPQLLNERVVLDAIKNNK